MARFVRLTMWPRKMPFAAACLLVIALLPAAPARAQRIGRPRIGGPLGGRVLAPHVARPFSGIPAPRPAMVAGPRFGGPFESSFGFRRPFLPIFRRPLFNGAPFFAFGLFPFTGYAWLECGAAWGWEFGCADWLLYAYPPVFQPAVVPPMRYPIPVYVYGAYGERELELVQLFFKDGTVVGVTDYWFVDDKIYFTVSEAGGTKSAEQTRDLDELDLPTTIDVNTRRGFRVVKRDEPMQQYVRDHPDTPPPLLPPPPGH
jgi:hypothetical protein